MTIATKTRSVQRRLDPKLVHGDERRLSMNRSKTNNLMIRYSPSEQECAVI
ncbi:unnamed protein product [Anisakis simplex]|uniref:Uncharacterized protein n=1 Tax=Anisakis simplex TaxID=6269 RepID=A0A3P6Q961_ANISI|nr:unnamed protein product [Anisakis simplex]